MKLVVLCDNNTYIDNYLLGEPALSIYIESDSNTKTLFDLGYSNVYKLNAKKLGIDISNVDNVVFSHGHDDHTRGLKYFDGQAKRVFYCEGCFEEKMSSGVNISAPFSLKKMEEKFNLCRVNKPSKLSKNLYVLGQIPRRFEFENEDNGLMHKEGDRWVRDDVLEDTALVYLGKEGLTIITGCSHSGICNICEQAKSVFGKNVYRIIGGLHLMRLSGKVDETIKYLKNNVKEIYACHCTSLDVKAKMIASGLNLIEVGSGLILNID